MPKKDRYNSQERIGVLRCNQVIIEQFAWIFRPQPNDDVGVDAIVEQSTNGDPTGKLLAFQIKSGESHFYRTETDVTYYLSSIHYSYWLNLDIPVILALFSPNDNCIYWAHIIKKNITKANKRWKIKIPKTQKLNLNSKSDLENIIHRYCKQKQVFTDNNLNSLLLGIFYGELAFDSVSYIEAYLNRFNEYTKNIVEEINENNFPSNLAIQIANMASLNNVMSLRLENECSIFSESFPKFILEYRHILQFSDKKSLERFKIAQIANLSKLIESFDVAVNGVSILFESLRLFVVDHTIFERSKQNLLGSLEFLIVELKISRDYTQELMLKIQG